nr:spore gernimation protein GerPD [Gracilibacillus ureilyticus]
MMGVSSSSLFLIGDSENIQLASSFDTPPESYIVGAQIPVPPNTGEVIEQAND